jgi:hypothetical protein
MPVSQASAPPILRTRRAGLVDRAVGAIRCPDRRRAFSLLLLGTSHATSIKLSAVATMALDRAGIEAAPRQHAGDRTANKLARMAWAVLARGREYQPMIMPRTA